MSDRRPVLIPWLRRLHRWLGLALAAPLLVMGVTGFILVLSPALDALLLPAAPVAQTATARDEAATVAAVIDAARTAARTAVADDLVPLRYRPGAVAQVDLGNPAQRLPALRVLVDPQTLAVLRVTPQPDQFYRWVHSLHESLLLPAPFGRSIIGCIGIGLLVLSLLGIPLWWPRKGRWKAAFTVSGRSRGYLLQREVHGAGAIWIVAMLLLQGFSGASMAFPQTFRGLFGVAAATSRGPSARTGSGRAEGGTTGGQAAVPDQAAIERLVRDAHAAVPDADLIDLRLRTMPGRPAMVFLLPKDSPEGAPAAVVTADPASLHLTGVQDPRKAGWGLRTLGWLRTLHSGEGLGPIWRTAVGILGLMLPVLSVTGVAMWLLRRSNRWRRAPRPRDIMQRAGE